MGSKADAKTIGNKLYLFSVVTSITTPGRKIMKVEWATEYIVVFSIPNF